MIKVGMISLGCPKNQVDAEVMLGCLSKEMEIVNDTELADVVIVNTCGFIQSAKEEAIENILEMCKLKEDGVISKVIVSGCLAQRYEKEILDDIPEVDAVVGLSSDCDIVSIVKSVMDEGGREYIKAFDCLDISGERLLSTPGHYAYIKIADGCDNRCTYCAIPMIRGNFVSRPMDDIVKEAKELADQGVKELIVVAQDTTNYGMDIYAELKLADLLEKLNMVDGIEWIRILYCYPQGMTDELIDLLAADNKILPYIDIPLQHISDSVLKRMNRKMGADDTRALLENLRARIPNLELRTTLLTGFPGESEDDFEELTRFVMETKFQKLGCFAFSCEEGTPAEKLDGQLDDEIKEHRAETIMTIQSTVMESERQKRIGQKTVMIIESRVEDGLYIGREWRDAPEIDFNIWLESEHIYKQGDIVTVLIKEITDCEFTAIETEE